MVVKRKSIVVKKRKKRNQRDKTTIFFLGGCVFFFICILIVMSFFQDDKQPPLEAATVKAETAVFMNPSTRAEQISFLEKDVQLFFIKEGGKQDGNDWSYVTDGDIEGWILNDYLEFRQVKGIVLIPKTLLSLKEKPSFDAKVKKELPGETNITAKSITKNKQGEVWVNVVSKKEEGWLPLSMIHIANDETLIHQSIVFVKHSLNVKKEKNKSSETIASLKEGNRLYVKKVEKDRKGATWYKINIDGEDGFVPKKETVKKMNVTYSVFIHEDKVPIVKKPSKNAEVINHLSFNTEVMPEEEVINAKNEIWFKMKLENGEVGYLPFESVSQEKTKVAYLTFDDGPTETTEKLLNILNEYDAKATFFMLEPHIREYPQIVKKMIEDGNAVGSHSVSHNKALVYASKDSVVYEMQQGLDTIEQVTGVTSHLIRVPYGSIPHMKPEYIQAVEEHEMQLWDWNVDSNDWRYKNNQFIESTMAQVQRIEEKGQSPIILLHDRQVTTEALPELIERLQKLGYQLEPLNETMTPFIFPR